MKTPSDDLFRLIQSMTASEKRYLKLHYCSSKSCLTELFNYLNSLAEYDEKQVKKHFVNNNRKLSKNLKVYKVQLIDLILKGLTSFHAKKKVASQVRQGLEEVGILIDKSLFNLASSRLKKLYKLCQNHHLHQLAISVLDQKIIIDQLQHKESQLSIFDAIGHHLTCIRRKLKLQQVAYDLQDHIFQSKTDATKELQSKLTYYRELVEQKTPFDEQGGLSNFLQEKIRTDLAYCLHQDEEEFFQLKKELVEHFDEFPQLVYPDFYRWKILMELLLICEQQERFDYMFEIAQQMKDLQARSVYPFDLTITYLAEIKYLYTSAGYRELEYRIDEGILDRLEENEQGRPDDVKQCLLFLVLFFMAKGEDQKAQSLLLKIYSEYKDKEKHSGSITNLIELIHHYESNDNTVLQYFLNTFQRRARRSNSLNPFFAAFIKFIKQLSKTDFDHKPALAAAFRLQLECFSEDTLYQQWTCFSLTDWLDALEHQCTFSEYKLKMPEDKWQKISKPGFGTYS